MPVNLFVKNVPDDVVRALRNRAALKQRSLQEEVLDILKQAARDQEPVTLDHVLKASQRKKRALDEEADRVRAAQEADHKRAAQRFEDLLTHIDTDKDGRGKN
jgi:plasmid stability protein